MQRLINWFPPGLLCDLLWSDPDKEIQGWGENDRGVSFTFGADVVARFLNRHDLDLICRAHQVCCFCYCSWCFYMQCNGIASCSNSLVCLSVCLFFPRTFLWRSTQINQFLISKGQENNTHHAQRILSCGKLSFKM